MAEIEEINENNVTTASKKERVGLVVHSMLALSFITFNILMAYSLINKFFKNNDGPLQGGAVLLCLAVAVTLLALSLFYYQKCNRRSDESERDRLKNKNCLICWGILPVFILYVGSVTLTGIGTIFELVKHGLNDDNNKILLAGVVGTIVCSLLIVLYPCIQWCSPSKDAESSKNSETIESIAVSNVEGNPHIAEQRL